MKIINNIISFIYAFFSITKNKNNTKKEIEDKDYLCQLSFCLNDKKEIDIYCKLPDLEIGNIKALNNSSMIVAEFLHIINSGKLEKQTLSLIQQETEYNAEEKLFFDNIVFYLTLLNTEKNKKHKGSTNEPLIRPSRVFNK
jgi:hypothetical protein